MRGHDGAVSISTALDNTGIEKGLGRIKGSLGGLTKTVTKTAAVITTAFATVAVAITKQSVAAYAEYEQLVGGIETLFKNSASKLQKYADDAFYTAGVSANKYMETVTSFSAGLISSLGGDTEKAADIANMAMVDMSDNANKMGSTLESIQNAYQGFAKQNYTMLDNLKLGYGGTKTEMERLLADAQKLTGVKYDISNLSDVYSAIHIVQENLGIAGTTAKEAEKTIAGAGNMTKAAWKNVLTAISGGGDLDKAINNLVYSITKYFENIVPVVERSLAGIGQLIEKIAPQLVQTVATALIKAIPSLLNAVYQMILGLANGIYQGIVALFTGGSATGDVSAQLNDVAASAGAAADAEFALADGIKAAGKAAKKSMAGFDELNILQSNAASSASGNTQSSGSGISVSVNDATSVTDGEGLNGGALGEISNKLKEILGFVPVIAAGFAGIKLGGFITDLLTANIQVKTLKDAMLLLGKKTLVTLEIAVMLGGIALFGKGIGEAFKEGVDGVNFAEILGGGALGAGAATALGSQLATWISTAFAGSAVDLAITQAGINLGVGTAGAAGAAIVAAGAGIVLGIPTMIVSIYDAIVSGIDWLNAALVGVGATAAGAGIGAIIGMVGGPIGAGIGALIGLAVGLVTDLVILIVQKWDEICAFFAPAVEWFDTNIIQPVGEFFSGLWESISKWASGAWEDIKNFFAPAVQWFSKLFNSVSQTLSDVFYNIGVIASGCWEVIKAVWGIVSSWFNETVVQPVAGFFTTLWDGFVEKASVAWEGVKTVFGKVASFFSDTFKKAWAGVVKVFSVAGDIFTDIKDGILTAFKSIVNGIIKGINSAISVPFDGINWALNKIKSIEILGLTPFSTLKTISVPQIPYLAQGAVLPANKPFMAMVGDQKHGTNIEAPLDTIKQALAEVMATQSGGDITINFTGDLAQLARVLNPVIEIEGRRVGGSLVRKAGT